MVSCLETDRTLIDPFVFGTNGKGGKNLICYCDGDHDLLSIAEKIQASIWELLPIVEQLTKHGLLVPSRRTNELKNKLIKTEDQEFQ